MTYLTLDKKYRPFSFDEVIGQSVTVNNLKEMITNNKLPSTIMLTGPHGTGKTSIGRLIAKYVNCTNKNEEVCTDKDKLCTSCKGIMKNNSHNVVEVNAANARGIDDIRALIEESKLAPLGGKKRIFIIDEIHQITSQAAQALLKPLEEPSPKTMWILCTTEPQKIIKTIRSRCLIFNLRLVSINNIIKRLQYVCKTENKELPDSILQVIAEFSQGHVRDAMLMLEQVLLYTAQHGIQDNLAENIMTVFDHASNIPPEILAKKYVHALLSGSNQIFNLLRRTENHRFLLTLVTKFLKNMIFYLEDVQELIPQGFEKFLSKMDNMLPFDTEKLTYLLDLHLQAYERTKDYDVNIVDILDFTVLKCQECIKIKKQ